MNEYHFVKCLNPKKLRNPYTGEVVIAECGQCEACRLKQAYTRTMRCNLEGLSHKYCAFVTLTYATQYLPLMKLVHIEAANNVDFEAFRYRGNCLVFDGKDYNTAYHYPGEYLGHVHTPHVLALSQLQKKMNFCNDEKLFYCLDYYDVQLFIKRLRKRLNERIRLFTCGEYGPVHFRPHYHLLLWFSREETLDVLQSVVADCWPFGITDYSLSRGKVNSYVARYVNGSQYLPCILKVAGAKPFAHHSKFLGEKVLEAANKEYAEKDYRRFAKRRFCSDGLNTDVILWRSVKSRVFPRCQGFSRKSEHECIMSYRLNETARSWTKETCPSKNAQIIADYVEEYDTWHPVPIVENMLQYFISRYLTAHSPDREFFDKSKFRRMVYVELCLSRRFLRDICRGDTRYKTVQNAYRKIKEFYSVLDYDNLVGQIKYVNDTPSELRWFYYIDTTYINDLKKSLVFNQYVADRRRMYRNLMKHRELNDKNKMFNY